VTDRPVGDAATAGRSVPAVSVIVPVHQGGPMLGDCIAGLVASDLPRDRWELVIVDDGSTDGAVAHVASSADRVLRVEDGPRGPAHARNVGAQASHAPLLLFVDADVVVAAHTLRGFVELMTSDPTLSAAFGAYDEHPADGGLVSQYRNLLHHFVHHANAGEAETFWAGCGIVRRDAFDAVGGFDAARFPRPQVEDIALGYRLRDAGGRIRLEPSLTGTHLKRLTLAGMLRTDFADRAVPWSRLLLERGAGLDHAPLNLSLRHKLLTACAAITMLAAPLALVTRWLPIAALAVAGVVAMVLGNTQLFAFFARSRGAWFAVRAAPLQCMHHCVAALGAAWAIVTRPPVPLSPPRWSAAALAVAALALMLHAWLAWSARLPMISTSGDDAILLSLANALRDGTYRELWTVGTPTHAMYPPGYPLLLAMIGATGIADLPRMIGLNICASVLALFFTAVLAGRIAPWLGVATLVVLAPNRSFVHAAGFSMTEPVFTALVLATLVALPVGGRSKRRLVLAGACAIGASLTRSIGVALIAALLIEWMLERRWRAVALLGGASALTVGTWLAWTVRAPRLAEGSSYVADALYTPTAEPTPLGMLLAQRVATNVDAYLTRVVPDILEQPGVPGSPIDNLLGLALTLALGAAGTLWLVRRQRVGVLFLAAYAAVMALWPYWFARLVVPLLPLLVMLLLAGAWSLGARAGNRRRGAIVTAAVALLLAGITVPPIRARLQETAGCDRTVDARRSPTCVSEKQRDFFATVDELARLAPSTTPVLAAKAPTVFALSGRQSVRQEEALRQRDPDRFIAWLRERTVETVLLSHMHIQQWGLSPMLGARCRSFELVRSFPTHAAVLRLLPVDAPTPSVKSVAACEAISRWARVDWTGEVVQARLGIW
jgi:GT2 family glycosyltransferase